MKKFTAILLLITFTVAAWSQNKKIDSIERRIIKATSDTQRINLKLQKLRLMTSGNLDSAIKYGRRLLSETEKIGYRKGEANTRTSLAGDYIFVGNYNAAQNNLDSSKAILINTADTLALGKLYSNYGMMYSMQNKFDKSHFFYNKSIAILSLKNHKDPLLSTALQNNAIAYQQESNYPMALTNYQQALKISEDLKDTEGVAYIELNLAITYRSLYDNGRSEQFFLKAIVIANKLGLKNVLAYAYANIAGLYEDQNKLDKQYDFSMKAAALGEELGDKGIEATSLSRAATALAKEKKFDEALKLNGRAIGIAALSNQPYNIFQTNAGMGLILKSEGKYREAIPYYEKAFKSLSESDLYDMEVGSSYASLSESYEKTGNFSKALAAYKISSRITDSIRGRENVKKSTELRMNYDFAKKQQLVKNEQLTKDADNKRIKDQQFFIISILGLIVLAAIIVTSIQFKNNRHKQRAYNLLQKQKGETDEQRQKTETALSELKLTQSQLIQSAKMASLGELTAGIAHEIQNPLNFVNNFSEVSAELVDEMDEELDKGDVAEAKAISAYIKQNLQKIHHHGKRADFIVKGMLEHSRTSTGERQVTNINVLADEFLKLSYHGFRVKDKNFNADLATNFDNSIPSINIVQQDIGRVLVNLFSNAFYAVNQKAKMAGSGYKPTVEVSTAQQNEAILISVKDNGTGIPENIREKIMQPFFTTKPTGEGTGLGLSLSYDIVVKGHGGSINVKSNEGEGSEFLIQLPLS